MTERSRRDDLIGCGAEQGIPSESSFPRKNANSGCHIRNPFRKAPIPTTLTSCLRASHGLRSNSAEEEEHYNTRVNFDFVASYSGGLTSFLHHYVL